MSNIDTVKKFAELLEAKDSNGLQDLLADGFVGKGPTIEFTKQQTISFLQMLFTAFPDISFGLTDFEEKGDLIFCASHEKGTHNGVLDLNPFGLPISLPPTGKTFELPKGIFILRTANNKIVYFREEITEGGGLTGILTQLGIELP